MNYDSQNIMTKNKKHKQAVYCIDHRKSTLFNGLILQKLIDLTKENLSQSHIFSYQWKPLIYLPSLNTNKYNFLHSKWVYVEP